ncbi:MAG: sensor histidine kinase, partial [Burkholderiaceae bacterium]|nr:sensor histidine kinase [Burkholderiaceae bacterium]
MRSRRSSSVEHWSLAAHLIVLIVVATFAATSMGGWLLRERLHATVQRSFENQLRDRLQHLSAQFESDPLLGTRGNRAEQGDFGRIFSGWYWIVQRAGSGQRQSRSSWDSPLRLERARDISEGSSSGSGTRLALDDPTGRPLMGVAETVMLDGQSARIYVFGPMDGVLQEWQRIDRILLTTQILLMLALALLAIATVRFCLRPLRRLRQQLGRVHSGDAPAIGQGYGPDLDPVAATIDQVLQRNAQVAERARHQAADLSHALKKPLAVLGIEARKPSVSGAWLQSRVQAISHTIDQHLARFASGAGSGNWVELGALIERLIALMGKIHQNRNLQWETDSASAPQLALLRWRGAASDFEEMAGNLLDNAGKWARGRVRIGLHADGAQHIVLQIEDDGPGLSEEQLQQVARRGQRFDENVAGHGLGLAIARDIAETYGGQLTVRRSLLGGLCCALRLPVA